MPLAFKQRSRSGSAAAAPGRPSGLGHGRRAGASATIRAEVGTKNCAHSPIHHLTHLPLLTPLLAAILLARPLSAATLSDPQVDSYNMRIGTQTFAGLYQFTTNNMLVETANAMTNMGSDIIKMYLGSNYAGKYYTNLAPSITNLWTLARNEPNARHVLDMPGFRHYIAWAYPLSNPDAPFQNPVYTTTEQNNDYREMYDLTRYLLTNYNNSGKTFYLGHWEGDGYLDVNNWSSNPSPTTVSNMVIWENTRQKGVDDARSATLGVSNASVFYYLEVNRVHDAIYNASNNNVRVANYVLPYVTNLDFVSYSSYDAMNYATSTLYPMLNYIQTNTPPIPQSKANLLPSCRLWIGEYGWGGSETTAQQEPTTRAYIQRLLNYSNAMPYILFWEMYNNVTNESFCLIDPSDTLTPCWYLHQRFYNSSRLAVACFKETNGRLPSDSEFVSLVSSNLNQAFPAPVALTIANSGSPTQLSPTAVQVAGTLSQGIYGDDRATVRVFYGPQDGGTTRSAWHQNQTIAINTNFNPVTYSTVISNLLANTNYFYRFYATNASTEAWSTSVSQITTPSNLDPSAYECQFKLTFSAYNRPETLTNFPVLVSFSTNLPGFSYHQFASPTGGDLRFCDSSGVSTIPFEIDEWNTNGTSIVWVNVPRISGHPDNMTAYWGNPLATTLPASSTNGAVWANSLVIYHLKEAGFPYADSSQQHPALSGVAPASTTGFLGKGCAFNGTSDYLDTGAFNLGNSFTLSAWINVSPSAGNMVAVWANKVGGWNANGTALFVNSWLTTDKSLRLETGDGSNGTAAYSATNLVSFGQWHLISAAVNRSAGTARLYLDGADCTQNGGVWTAFSTTNDVNVGRVLDGATYFDGTLDEMRIEAATRSSNWVWATWMTAVSNTTFATYSSVTQQSPVVSISSAQGGLSLTWLTPGTGFALYTAGNLAPPAVWTLATNQPTLVSNQWRIALPAGSNAVQFFRLQAQ